MLAASPRPGAHAAIQMSPTQIAAVGIRLFAIWLAIYCARWAPYLFGVAREANEVGIVVVTVLAALLSIFAVLGLWFFPRTVARTILPADTGPPRQSSPESWLAVGCTLIGLWVLTEAAPGLVRTLYVLLGTARAHEAWPPGWSSEVIYFSLEAGIAIWLVLGASGLQRMLRWARSHSD